MPDIWDEYVKNKKKKRSAANTLAKFVNSSNTKVSILDDIIYEDEPAKPASGILGSIATGIGAAIGTVVSSAGSVLGSAARSTGSALKSAGSKARSSLVAKGRHTSAFVAAKANEMWRDATYRDKY